MAFPPFFFLLPSPFLILFLIPSARESKGALYWSSFWKIAYSYSYSLSQFEEIFFAQLMSHKFFPPTKRSRPSEKFLHLFPIHAQAGGRPLDSLMEMSLNFFSLPPPLPSWRHRHRRRGSENRKIGHLIKPTHPSTYNMGGGGHFPLFSPLWWLSPSLVTPEITTRVWRLFI